MICWCAHLLRRSRSSLTRLRSAGPNVRRKTSFQASHMSFSSAAASHSPMAFLANRRSSPRKRVASARGLIFVRVLELALDERTEPLLEEVHRLSDTLVVCDRHGLLLLYFVEQRGGCWRLWLSTLARQAGDLRPALHEAVVRKRLLRALLALAHGVEAIAKFAGDLGLAAELRNELGRCVLAAGFQTRGSVGAPISHAVRRGSVVGSQSSGQLARASAAAPCRAFGGDDARLDHAIDAGVLGLGERLGHAVLALVES